MYCAITEIQKFLQYSTLIEIYLIYCFHTSFVAKHWLNNRVSFSYSKIHDSSFMDTLD